MSDFFADIWDVLHDGSIDSISGTVPGTVIMNVGIEYLRERFEDPGTLLCIKLRACTRFAYRAYDQTEFVTELDEILANDPDILGSFGSDSEFGGEVSDGMSVLGGSKGLIEIRAESGTLSLDSGREISLDELKAVATGYWEDFENRS